MLPDETVKTFIVCPSWLCLLDGEDNCMLSVPSSTCDLLISCWQSAKFARRWLVKILRCSTAHCGFFPNADDLFSVRTCCLANVLLAPRFPSSRPDTASIRSFMLLPPGFLDTRKAGICAGCRACFFFSVSSISYARGDMFPVISESLREMSLQALLKYEGPADT